MSAGRLVTRTCLACGRLFQARERDVARGRREGRPLGRTCSLNCANRLRHRSKPPQRLTKAQRRQVRDAHDYKCAQCHARAQLVVVANPTIEEPDPCRPDHHVPLCQTCANRFARKQIDPQDFGATAGHRSAERPEPRREAPASIKEPPA